jgi:hypothetical protein
MSPASCNLRSIPSGVFMPTEQLARVEIFSPTFD